MRVAKLRVSPDLLISALGLPSDTEVVGAQLSFSTDDIFLRIKSPHLPEVGEGEVIPTVKAIFSDNKFLRFSQ